MKSIYRSIIIVWMLLLPWSATLSAQIGINTDDSAPEASAMLDVKSTTKGILLPRMSSTERNNITAPAAGLLLFDSDTQSFWFYNGSAWTDLNTGIATTTFIDADQDTKIELEESADDAINFDIDGTHYFKMINGKIASSNQRFNVYLGGAAGYTDDLVGDNRNVGIGDSSLFHTTTGRFNTAIGYRSMYSNVTGRENASNGYQALANISTGEGNVALGYNAMHSNLNGDNNVAIGWEADVQEGLTNAVAIGKSVTAVQNNSFILGDGNSNVGIGTSDPQASLHIVGQVQIQDGTEADGYALTTDADGLASWQPYEGDNFGDHTAIQNIDFNSKNITNAGSLEFDTNDDQLKILLNAKTGSGGTTILGNFFRLGVLQDQTYGYLSSTGPKEVYQSESNSPPAANYGWLWTTDSLSNSEGLMSLTAEGKLTVAGDTWIKGKMSVFDQPTGTTETLRLQDGDLKINGSAIGLSLKANTSDGLILNTSTAGDIITIKDNGDVNFGPANGNNRLYVEENFSTSSDAASEYPVYVANASNSNSSPAVCNGMVIQAGRKTNDGANSRYMAFKRPDDNTIGRIIQSSGDNVSYSTTSDERLKTNITASALGLSDLMQIKIFDYNYIGENPAKRRQGYLAQQLYQIYPQTVEKGGADVKQFAWMVDYGAITPLLVKSLQDQEPIIQEQAALIQEQEGLIEQLETQVEALQALKALVQQLEAQIHSSISNSSN